MSKKLIVILLTTAMLILSCPFIYANINDNSPVNVLSELKIADKEDLNKKEPIATIEALNAISNVFGKYKFGISSWYLGDTLKDMDYLDDDTKRMLMNLSRNEVLIYKDIPKLKLDAPITRGDALLYIVRSVGDTYACVDNKYDYYNIPEEVYNAAYEKGLIPNADISDKDKTISCKDFYNILAKSLYVEYTMGGYASQLHRNIDYLKEINYEESTETTTEEIKIPLEVHIDDNLNISWKLPDEYKFIETSDSSLNVYIIKNDGSKEYCFKTEYSPVLDSIKVVNCLVRHKDEGIKAIRCEFSEYNADIKGYNWVYYHDIDVSDIKIITEGNEIKPGIYIKQNASVKSVTLADGISFEPECYYILKGSETGYRKDEYNTKYYDVFKPENEANIYTLPKDSHFTVEQATSDIHIMKASITKNADDGYTLHITPESTVGFEIKYTYTYN